MNENIFDNNKEEQEEQIKKLSQKEILEKNFNDCIDKDVWFDKDLDDVENIRLLSLNFKNTFKLVNSNAFMFKYNYENCDSILMIFAVPFSLRTDNKSGHVKHISERIMEIVGLLENSFIELDHMFCREVKEDKSFYLVAIKKIKEED